MINGNLAGVARGTFEPALVRAAYGSLGRKPQVNTYKQTRTRACAGGILSRRSFSEDGNRLLHDAITLFFVANGYAARTSAGSYSFYSQPGAYAPGYHISPAQVRVQMFGGHSPRNFPLPAARAI